MINTFAVANLLTDLLPFSTNPRAERISFLPEQTANRIRARISPRSSENAEYYAPDTISWLRLQPLDTKPTHEVNNTITYTVTQLGITNRPLPGYKKAGFNLFKTMAKVTLPSKLKNFDQCTVEFSQRLPIHQAAFNEELAAQLSCLKWHIKTKGRLIFYSHTACNLAVSSDFEALRLSALKALPVLNVDWLDIDGGWDVIWNPCSNLKPVRKKLETKLIHFLDRIVEQVCASRCDSFVNGRGSFLTTTYLPHRDQSQLPKLKKIWQANPVNVFDRVI